MQPGTGRYKLHLSETFLQGPQRQRGARHPGRAVPGAGQRHCSGAPGAYDGPGRQRQLASLSWRHWWHRQWATWVGVKDRAHVQPTGCCDWI
jgi:hypothetical protein